MPSGSRAVVAAALGPVLFVAACGGTDSPAGTTRAPAATAATAATTSATTQRADDDLDEFWAYELRFADGTVVALAVDIGSVRAFDGSGRGWESEVALCADATSRDAYIPIRYEIRNETDGFEVPTTFYRLMFRNDDRGTRNLQLWQENRGCQPPDDNFGHQPLNQGEIKENILLRDGGGLEGRAALILVDFFTPNQPSGRFGDEAYSLNFVLRVGGRFHPDADGIPVALPTG